MMIRTLLFLTVCAMGSAQQQTIRNPHNSADDVAAGGRIYRSHCAECHGLKGEGGRGPDLTRGEYRHGSSDAALFKTVDEGVPGTQMPGLYHEEVQLWQVVAFVRTLASGGARQQVSGNRDAGEKVFSGKGGCSACHMVNGRGGRLGPDLSDVGSLRSPENLRRSLLQPDDDLPMRWWTVEASTKNGKPYRGVRLNEDTYTIQILDFQKDLVSLDKSSLSKLHIETKKSSMPGYEAKLSSGELQDVIAYLYGLQRKGNQE